MFNGELFGDCIVTPQTFIDFHLLLSSIDGSYLHGLSLWRLSSGKFLIPLFLFCWLAGIDWRASLIYLLRYSLIHSFIHTSMDAVDSYFIYWVLGGIFLVLILLELFKQVSHCEKNQYIISLNFI